MAEDDSMSVDRRQALPLELLLYLEDKHGYAIDPIDVVMALCDAAVEAIAYSLNPDGNGEEVIDMLAENMKQQLRHRLAEPQPMSPREVIEAYKAEREGRPWRH